MGIEQTNQLILLILNSVLMALLAAVLLGGTWLRQNTLFNRLSQVRSHYHRLTNPTDSFQPPEVHALKKTREYKKQLTYQYHWSRIGLLALHIAVMFFGVSVLVLTLRSHIAFDSLISSALCLFMLGVACLLIGTGCLLIDLAYGNSCGDSLGHTFAQVIQQLVQQRSMQKATQKAMQKVRRHSP